MKKIHVCTTCGSPRVKRDAWVDVNDPDNVTTFDDTICDDCGKERRIYEVEVPDDFDMESDFASRDSQSKGLPQRETVEAAGNPDSEHLDWLEAHPEFLLRIHKGRWFCTPFTNHPYNSYSTLREALRAAVEGTWNK